ncbi:hypothetical protein ACLB6G_04110 [Zhengella sp. ZM62]|uniref:hypothetical protein n=1 Tax=Zhengella sedimenti TaxID=3390035 RepID=UPI00397495B8
MKKLIIAASLVVAATGMAAAESNVLYTGNYSASVLERHGAAGVTPIASVDYDLDRTATASITAPSAGDRMVYGNYSGNVTAFDLYGR